MPSPVAIATRWVAQSRVAHRFLQGKATPKLVPAFQKALEKVQQGDTEPLMDFCQDVLNLIFPDGGEVARWFWALGTAKRNSINSLQKSIRTVLALKPQLTKKPENVSFYVRADEWLKQIRTLELATVDQGAQAAIQHGPWKVIPMPGITQKEVDRCLDLLDKASAKLRSTFPKVLYGDCYLSTHLKQNTGAWYSPSGDEVYLDVRSLDKFSNPLQPILHELGHRYDHKFLKPDLKRKFWDLSTRKVFETITFDRDLRSKMADEVVSLAKQVALGKTPPGPSSELKVYLPYLDGPRQMTSDFLAGKMTERELHQAVMGSKDIEAMTDKVLHGPLAVSNYGATKPSENWAEAFAFYALGLDMPPELAACVAEAAG